MMENAIRQIQVEIEQYVDAISTGAVEDYAEYRKLVGHISGLMRAKQIMQDLLARAERDPD